MNPPEKTPNKRHRPEHLNNSRKEAGNRVGKKRRKKRRRKTAELKGETILLDAVSKHGVPMQTDISSPEGWGRSVETLFCNRVAQRIQNPPDGPRPSIPPTRANAPGEEWAGIMVTDCGYETMKQRDLTTWTSLSSSCSFTTRDEDVTMETETNASDVPNDRMPVYHSDTAVWMTGRDEWGRSVCIWLHHMVPYFFVGIADTDPGLTYNAAVEYAGELHRELEKRIANTQSRRSPEVLGVHPVKRSWFYGYKPDRKQDKKTPKWNLSPGNTDFEQQQQQQPWDGGTTQASDWYLKVSAAAPYHINMLRKWCAEWAREKGRRQDGETRWRTPVVNTTSTVKLPVDLTVFEANVEFAIRIMVDLGLVGYGWCAINTKAGKQQGLLGVLSENDRRKRSRCELEYVVDGRIFEEAMATRDAVLSRSDLVDTEVSWDAIRRVHRERNTCIRFVAREAKYQRYTDGVHFEEDPHQAWFEDLREATAPITIMSFDIECCNRRGTFPDPTETDSQVINLAARVYRLDRVEAYERERARYEKYLKETTDGSKEGDDSSEATFQHDYSREGVEDVTRTKHPPPFDAVVMGLGDRLPMDGGDMDGYPVTSVAFSDERELFIAFAKLILAWDPDVIEGYNSVAFDMAYMLRRAEVVLGVERVFWDLGRFPGRLSKPQNDSFGNKASGKMQVWRAPIDGRAQFDILDCTRKDISLKLRRYTLNSVAYELLGEGKYDMEYALIPEYHFGTPATRRKLDQYCDTDTVLPFKIERKQSYLMRAIEMARVTGVPMNFYLTKGQQVLVFTQLLRKAKEGAYAIPWIPVVEPERSLTDARRVKAYQGAIVIDPKKGFYRIETDGVVGVLDFAALYPSEMRAENLGYTTALTDPAASKTCHQEHLKRKEDHDRKKRETVDRFYDGEQHLRDYEHEGGWKVAPVNAADGAVNPVFVRHEVRKSLLVGILEDLTAARSRAKKAMGRHPKGSAEWEKQNARQMALKVCNNSVYGFTGAVVGRLPHLWISAATTGYGRVSLYFVMWLVDELLPGDNEVIYGDTDSVMVLIKDAATRESPEPGTPYSSLALRNIKMAYERAEMLADEVNKRLVYPMELELEKLFLKYLLMKKKKYVAEVWMKPDAPYGVDAKGIEMVRRDNPLIVGLACARFANILMGIGPKDPETGKRISLYPDIELAKAFLTEVHRRILNADRIPIDAYVISGKFGKPVGEYVNTPAHITLAKRMQIRDPASAPKLGDRVPFVIVKPQYTERAQKHHKTSALVSECSEDPKYAERMGMEVDTYYYATEKLIPTFLRILAPVLAPKELASAPPTDFVQATRQRNLYRNDLQKYEEWYERDRLKTAQKVVFQSVFERNYQFRKRRIRHDKHTPIGKFFQSVKESSSPREISGESPSSTQTPHSIDRHRQHSKGGAMDPSSSSHCLVEKNGEKATVDGDDDDDDDDDEEEQEIDEDVKTTINNLLEEMYRVALAKVTETRRQRELRRINHDPSSMNGSDDPGRHRRQQSLMGFFTTKKQHG